MSSYVRNHDISQQFTAILIIDLWQKHHSLINRKCLMENVIYCSIEP